MRLRPIALAAAFAAVSFALLFTGATSRTPQHGGYTPEQATRGEFVYVEHCLTCHGNAQQGGAGPALSGPAFAKSITLGAQSTPSLFHFISTSMPMDAPGTLRKQQYLDVLAFILAKNGYPPGDMPLTAGTLAATPLLPYPHAVSPTPPAPVLAQSTGSGAVPDGTDVTVTDAMMAGAERDPADWLLPGRTLTNQRYSPLTQITSANVGQLAPVAIVHTHMFASFETTPIVVHGVMYVTTPTVEHVLKIAALDAATGKNLWTTEYHVGDAKLCCGPNNRGAAVAYGNVYVTTLDDKLLALDARTGKERWETRVADPAVGYSESMAPQIDRGLVIVGSAGGEWALRGFVAAYDAHTGAQKWRWYTTDPKTFAGDSWKTGGGTVWTTPAIDRARDLVIFGVGNPNPDLDGSARAGDNLYTDSIVALDVRTGALRWHYQEVKHDQWDYDATSNVVLFDVHAGGKTIPAAGQPGKVGWYFIVDRRNGKLIRRSQPFVLQSKDIFGKKHVLPGANGGSEWSPSAYSPRTRMAYVLGMDQMMDFTTATPGRHPGFIRVGSGFTSTKKPLIQAGRFSAIDVESGRIAWQYKAPKPLIGGALATAGDLVFTGEGDGTFEAFDARTGKRLWRYGLIAGVNAPPVSYEVDGKQYVAVAAGGNYQLNYGRGDQIVIFALK